MELGREVWDAVEAWNKKGLTPEEIPRLGKLPEQTRDYPETPRIWSISCEFMSVIERMPYYAGILREDGHAVYIGFLRSLGYLPHVPLRAYFMGEVYAKQNRKSRALRVPRKFETDVIAAREKTLRELLKELQTPEIVSYRSSSGNLLSALRRANDRI